MSGTKPALWAKRLDAWAPFLLGAFKIAVSVLFLNHYLPKYYRLMYIADGPARGIEAYRLAFMRFELFPTHQFPPLPLWLWAALLKIWPSIYFTGTALNVVAGAFGAGLLYSLGRRLAGPVGGVVAALLFTFSPVHHNLTLSDGMAEPIFYAFLLGGILCAARAEAGKPGATGALYCLAGAALSRYEGTLFLILYAFYRLFTKRPKNIGGWLVAAVPLAVVGVFSGHKAFIGTHEGLWPALAGVRADTALVLKNPTWYRRLGYGFYRLVFDGRASAVLAFVGAVVVWFRPWRTRERLVIWAAPAAIFAGLVIVAVVAGLGFCPERYFGTPLLLLFPFAGLAVVVMIKWATTPQRMFAVTAALGIGGIVTIGWDATIAKPGYGFRGQTFTMQPFAAETAFILKDLWLKGELKPGEVVIIEKGSRVFEEYSLRSYTDHPLHFLRVWTHDIKREMPVLVRFMESNNTRILILLSKKSRNTVKKYYPYISADAVIYENPTQTIIVLRKGWRVIPDFASRFRRDEAVVYDAIPVPPSKKIWQ